MWREFGRLPGMPYVVSRKNDTGHYERDNVYIQHNLHNIMENYFYENGVDYSDTERAITDLAISKKIKRTLIRNLISRGELVI